MTTERLRRRLAREDVSHVERLEIESELLKLRGPTEILDTGFASEETLRAFNSAQNAARCAATEADDA